MKTKFYITSAIPYVNAKPHIGHALEFVQANTIARFQKLLGQEVLSLCGGDENALKNVQAAERAGEPIQKFVDKNSELFRKLTEKLNASYDVWQKGSDQTHHYPSSQKLWRLCQAAGDIYKKSYKGLYCVGCETFYATDELNSKGECFEHPGRKLEEVEEENYFFRLSKYQNPLIHLIESDQYEIIPTFRKNEVLSFLKGGLQDISISRTNERAKNWGVPVPGDPSQREYVWLDALNIYQSGIGFGWNETKYQKWWPADLHVIGKGIIRFHAIYWPAFLISAKLPLPKKLFVHGYYTVNGQKMSKTLGNVLDPLPLIGKYGTDSLRYFFLAKTPPFDDGDFSEEKLKETYSADLANGIGNLIARVAKLCETSGKEFPPDPGGYELRQPVVRLLEEFKFNETLLAIRSRFSRIDKKIETTRPWTLQGKELHDALIPWVEEIRQSATDLSPFLPETSEKILKQFAGPKIQSAPPLFPRLNAKIKN